VKRLKRLENKMSNYTDLLERYAQFVGLTPVEALLSAEEVVVGDVTIGLMNEGGDAGEVVFFARLGQPTAAAGLEAVYRLMLQANALWSGTGGNTIGLHEPSGEALLCGRVPLALCTAQTLSGLLEAFSDTARVWREIVQGRVPAMLPSLAA